MTDEDFRKMKPEGTPARERRIRANFNNTSGWYYCGDCGEILQAKRAAQVRPVSYCPWCGVPVEILVTSEF